MGYQGREFILQVKEAFGIDLVIIKRTRKGFWVPSEIEDVKSYLEAKGIDTNPGFKLLPKRWVVERTFAWLSRYRRMSKGFEYLPDTSACMIFTALGKNMLRRAVKLFQ